MDLIRVWRPILPRNRHLSSARRAERYANRTAGIIQRRTRGLKPGVPMQMSRARRDTAKKSASIRITTSYRGASIRREWFRDTVQIRRQTRQPS